MTPLAAIVRARFDPVRLARPFLEGLWERFDETAVLCIYNPASHTGTVIDALLTTHPLRFAVEIGMELALPWGSLGQAMLAHLAPKEIEAVLRGATIGPISGRPLASRAEVLDDLMAVREQGYADYYDPAFDVAGCVFRIGLQNAPRMPWDIEFRHDPDAAIRGIGHEIANVGLRIEFGR